MSIKTKSITFECTRTNEQTVVVGNYKDVILKVDYFWNNHGDLIKWNDSVEEPTFWSHADVQIRRYSFTEEFFESKHNFSMLQLVVNGKTIPGDVLNYITETEDGGTTVSCRLAVGWG